MLNEKIEYVPPGKVIVGRDEGHLVSTPLGSCIAVIMYDASIKTGGMAHVMLPGKSLDSKKTDKYKYAEEAIPNLYQKLILSGVEKVNLNVGLVGGANVLKKEGDTLVEDIIGSVLNTVNKIQLRIIQTSLRGYERRSATLDLKTGNVFFTVGDCCSKILCKL